MTMYAKIASTQYEDAEKFGAVAIKQMEGKHGKPTEKIDKAKLKLRRLIE
jgi:hypothetical protein